MRPSDRHCRGAAAAEFLVVSIPLLLAGLGCLEAARWHMSRQVVAHALHEAARAGAVLHADPAAIRTAMTEALVALEAGAVDPASRARAAARRAAADARLASRYGLAPWRIEVVSPTPAHFDDFGRPAAGGGREIGNDYQRERHQAAIAAGLAGGRGARSGETVFSANVLTLRLTYLHEPVVPGMRWLLRGLGQAAGESWGALAMRSAGVLPLRREFSIVMQSAPREGVAARAITPDPAAPPRPLPAPQPDGLACRGLWCAPAGGDAGGVPGGGPGPRPGDPVGGPPTAPAEPGLPGEADGCGVVICCTA